MRLSLVRCVVPGALAAAGMGLLTCAWAVADPPPAGEVALCFDDEVRVSAWQASYADGAHQPIPSTVNMNATDGRIGPKQADYHWRNLTTGASGDAHGRGYGPAGASIFNVVTGPGQIEITTDYGGRSGPFNSVANSGECTGTVTVI